MVLDTPTTRANMIVVIHAVGGFAHSEFILRRGNYEEIKMFVKVKCNGKIKFVSIVANGENISTTAEDIIFCSK